MISIESNDVVKLAQEVENLCSKFLHPRDISYFQFKRIYKNSTSITLANHTEFFEEFLPNGFVEPSVQMQIDAHQSSICFWDESLPEEHLSLLKETQGIYHGFTILSRKKIFYDCTTFAMSKPHPAPVTYYFYILKQLQTFAELFPTVASHLIKNTTKIHINNLTRDHYMTRKKFFLPKRSSRFIIGEDINNYVTTYEALCVELFQAGKSHKEIGSILSMASSTVKTHLKRLRSRTGLTLQDISLKSFQTYNNSKIVSNSQKDMSNSQ